jgi:hypothetical protein
MEGQRCLSSCYVGKDFGHIVVEEFSRKELKVPYGEKEKGPQTNVVRMLSKLRLELTSKIMYRD